MHGVERPVTLTRQSRAALRGRGLPSHCRDAVRVVRGRGHGALGARAHGVREELPAVRRHRQAAAANVRELRGAGRGAADRDASPFACRPGFPTARACGWRARATPGVRGGAPGDLYVDVHVEAHPSSAGTATTCTSIVPIAVHEAALGTRIEVATPDGPVRVRVPPGTHRANASGCASGRAVDAQRWEGRSRGGGAAGAAEGAGRAIEGTVAGVRPHQRGKPCRRT